jgi:hypothetical protein
MRHVFLIGAVLALAARVTVFAHGDPHQAFVSFVLFWVFAVGYVASEVTS